MRAQSLEKAKGEGDWAGFGGWGVTRQLEVWRVVGRRRNTLVAGRRETATPALSPSGWERLHRRDQVLMALFPSAPPSRLLRDGRDCGV